MNCSCGLTKVEFTHTCPVEGTSLVEDGCPECDDLCENCGFDNEAGADGIVGYNPNAIDGPDGADILADDAEDDDEDEEEEETSWTGGYEREETITGTTVISKPGDPVEVTVLHLSESARAGLTTDTDARIPGPDIRALIAEDGDGSGYGYGDGDGDGDGDGSGDGYGYGSGYGSGDGYGDGSGYGYGSGYGDGYGYGDGDIVKCNPQPVIVTAGTLHAHKACADQVAAFRRVFPTGATWPDDIPRARAAGLDLQWARQHLGLMLPR